MNRLTRLILSTTGAALLATVAFAQEITFWHSFTQPVRIAAMETIAADFEAAHGVKVNIEVVPWTQVTSKWTSAAAAGVLPDVSIALPDVAIDMWEAGVTLPLEPLLETMGGESFFVSASLLDRFHRYDGNLISLPFYAHTRLLLYRQDIFDEKGLTAPTTWEEYIDVVTALNDPPDNYGMIQMWSPTDWGATLYLHMFMRSNGAAYLDADGNSTFDTPETVEAVKQLVALYEAGSPPGAFDLALHSSMYDLFTGGKTAMVFDTLFVASSLQRDRPDLYESGALGVAGPPVMQETGWFTDVISLVKMRGSNETAADEFIRFLFDDDRYIAFLHTIPAGQFPVTATTAVENGAFFDHPVIDQFREGVEITLEGIRDGAALGMTYGPNKFAGLLKTGLVENMMQDIVVDGVAVEEAVANTHAELQALIDRQRARGTR
jgi:multiple sugar transport system substrate-binding protein